MSTTPTNNPIPSESVKDLAFNAGTIDEFVNSPEEAFSDRFGLARLTLTGIQAEADNVIGSLGFLPVDSFEAGATISSRNQSLHYLSDNNYYRWDGSLSSPKVVAASSTPASSGGIAPGAWVNVTDNTLRSQLASSGVDLLVDDSRVKIQIPFSGAVPQSLHDFSKVYVNVISFGADPSGTIDSTAAFQAAIDAVYSRGGGEVFIPATYGNGDGGNTGYKISSSIMLKPFVNLRGEGFSTRLKATTSLANGVVTIMAAGGISGRYIRDLTLIGTGSGVGLGTDLVSTATQEKQCYGYDIANISVEGVEVGMQLQGLWHSTLRNCTTSSCRVGLHLWGQNVSLQISGCHFKRDNYTAGNTFGIRIQPRIYTWSPDQARGSRSEAIIINGETMCIAVDYGVYVDDCLDLHMQNMDLDYILKSAVSIINVVGGFSLINSWIAADVSGTNQFFGVTFPSALDIQQHKLLQGLHINLGNANSSANNIGINIGAASVGRVSIRDTTTVNGWSGVGIFNNTAGVVLDNVIFGGCQLYLTGCGNVTVVNSSLNGISETLKQGYNTYKGNVGTPFTNGFLSVTVNASANSGTTAIPNYDSGKIYGATTYGSNSSNAFDQAYTTGSNVAVYRATPVGSATTTLVNVVML